MADLHQAGSEAEQDRCAPRMHAATTPPPPPLPPQHPKRAKHTHITVPAGDIWHVQLDGLPGANICYGYKISGNGGWETGQRWEPSAMLLDPYAPLTSGRRVFGKRDEIENFRGKVRRRAPQCPWHCSLSGV